MPNKLNEFQLDQLKEIMNIGASHASNALSQMVKQKVGLTIPYAYVDTAHNIKKYINNPKEKTKATLIKVSGDIEGLIYLLFSYENEQRLIDILLQNVEEKDKETMELSVINEVGNILAGSSLTAFSKFLGITLLHKVSSILNDSMEQIIKQVVEDFSSSEDLALIFQIDFNVKSDEISSHFLFLIDSQATETLLQALQNKYK